MTPFEVTPLNEEDKDLINNIGKVNHPEENKSFTSQKASAEELAVSEPHVLKNEPETQEMSASVGPVLMLDVSEQTHKFEHHQFNLNEESTLKAVSYLQQTVAYIEIRIEDPRLSLKTQPEVIKPALLVDDPKNEEFVYPIFDYNDRLISSKSLSHEAEGMGMYKMFQTIEKMIYIMHRRLTLLNSDGGSNNDEVKVFLDGHILCKRKMFEVVINLADNWVVMNFDPGQWGNHYLDGLQKLYKKGYPYPLSAPRTSFQHKPGATPSTPVMQAKT